jgi:hypothetical protein
MGFRFAVQLIVSQLLRPFVADETREKPDSPQPRAPRGDWRWRPSFLRSRGTPTIYFRFDFCAGVDAAMRRGLRERRMPCPFLPLTLFSLSPRRAWCTLAIRAVPRDTTRYLTKHRLSVAAQSESRSKLSSDRACCHHGYPALMRPPPSARPRRSPAP